MQLHLAHGAGNDFVVVDDRDGRLDVPPELVRALCHRQFGAGADGFIRLAPPVDDGVVFMDYRNADGSSSEMCGNGIRVVARLTADLGWWHAAPGREVLVETRAGTKTVTPTLDDGVVVAASVDMGPDDPEAVLRAFDGEPDGDRFREVVADTKIQFGITSMGNPHAVVLVDDTDQYAVPAVAAALAVDPRWPDGVNVSFLDPRGDFAYLRVFERGVGETLACGSGTCASFAVARRWGMLDDDVEFFVRGGELRVRIDDDEHLHLSGPVEVVGRVEVDPRWLATRTEIEG